MKIFKKLLKNLRAIIILLTPTLLIPLLVLNTKESKMGFVLILMAIYWATEVIPLATTGLFPLVLVPIFGILPAAKIGHSYMSDICILFLGSIIVALTCEHHNLHKKMALFVLSYVGSDPRLLMMGFMAPTWFLSMWINNTSATAMMVPIVHAVLIELKKKAFVNNSTSSSDSSTSDSKNNPNSEDSGLERKFSHGTHGTWTHDTLGTEVQVDHTTGPIKEKNVSDEELYQDELESMEKGFYLGVAYSASIGGMATITGTPPNFVLYGMLEKEFKTYGGLNFGSWLLINLPTSLLMVVTTWFWLGLYFIGPKKLFKFERNSERDLRVKNIIESERKKLGELNFAQWWCLFFFAVLVTLWITKSLGPTGWSQLFKFKNEIYVKDSSPAMMIAILLMVLPATNPFSRKKLDKKTEKVIMPWKVMQKRFPWGILVLIGGGLALADGCKASGLTEMLAKKLEILKNVNVILIVIILTTITSFLTELTSNTATASVLLPIILKLAVCMKVNPLLLSIPVTLSTSMAFCLPIATPSNTIVFTKDAIKVIDMIKAGLVLNILSAIVINIATFTYMNTYFHLFEMPSWAGECHRYNASSSQ